MRTIFSPLFLAAGTTTFLLLAPAPALADRIDGYWCFTAGRHLSIDGPAIVTSGGTSMTGDYNRHGFRYVAPAGEADAGAQIDMIQFDDDTIQVTTTPPDGPARTEIWKRCNLTT
jgi:hypothetical protein